MSPEQGESLYSSAFGLLQLWTFYKIKKVAIVHKYSKKVKKMYAYTGHIYRAYLKVEDRLIGHGRQRDGRDGADVVAQVVTDLKLKWKR